MTEKQATINNLAGIHCRPSSMIISAAQEYPGCRIRVVAAGHEVELDSILSLLGMGLESGTRVVVRADGVNEAEACERLAELFARNFDFPRPDDDHPGGQ